MIKRHVTRCIEISMVVLVVLLFANTICGTTWLVNFRSDHEDFLKTKYYIESIILLAIPILIACFFVIVFFVVMCLLFMEHRRMRRMQRLEDEGGYDEEYFEEVAETYMRMLIDVEYSSSSGML
jgi:hypothetical protein